MRPARPPGGFSVILPVRGTAREEGFIGESVAAAAALGPDQIVFGVDAGSAALERRLAAACGAAGQGSYSFARAPRSPAWGFQLAHVLWHCLKASGRDRVLFSNIDTALLPGVMGGAWQVGRGGVAVASHTLRLRLRTPADLLRAASYYEFVRRSGRVFAGVYWAWRPHFFDVVRMRGYASVRNIVDGYAAAEVERSGGYRLVTNKEAGARALDSRGEDLPWRQFQVGVWSRASDVRAAAGDRERWRRAGKSAAPRRPYFAARRAAALLRHSLGEARPHYLRGYLWAARNPGHEAVRAASSMGLTEWESAGSRHMRGVGPRGGEGTTGYG